MLKNSTSLSSVAAAHASIHQMQMAMHPAQVFAAGTKMQMVILPPPGCTWRHWFSAGMEIELMLMAMLPTVPEFPARMDMSQQ